MKWILPRFKIARVWVVDAAHPNASDSNVGDADHPFATIGRGVRACRPGDTLQIRAALYREALGEVRLLGTAAAPIDVTCEPGVVVRPTTGLVEPPTPIDGQLFSVPASGSHRLIETDAAAWQPILVNDPNGVHFELLRPVPTHPVKTLDALRDVPGSSWFDAFGQRVIFRPYGSCEHGLECYTSRTFSFRTTHTRIRGLVVEYAAVVQFYQAQATTVEQLALCGAALQLKATRDCAVASAFVEQVITRGDGFEWFDKGAGLGMQIDDACQRTTVCDVTVRHGWNGVSWGGTQTTVDRAVIYGFPNHNFGVSGTDNTYRRVKAYQAQEGLFAQAGAHCAIEDCELERALVVGGGHTLIGKPVVDLVLRRNTILGSGMVNASADSSLAASDDNYWLTTTFDWRYASQRATTLDDIRARFGFERRSVWDNRNLPR